ncbi:fungal protein [Schizosaccharomyces japonicus yFS275]|uniref:Fungal protein n=1 Tax=Schizosaccharomyces japonicus (strain yFS275 / FY16936) TaxID=402676 RepID=B6K0Q4_SCHJY|nr:fungal protein [Schizosaccharomyces japonicus yFS275]EEB07525.1 fungal protein [Schizosaccharomyces japonicus yFS275]
MKLFGSKKPKRGSQTQPRAGSKDPSSEIDMSCAFEKKRYKHLYHFKFSIPRILYLLIQAVGSFIISGGVEFAIAYGMYHNADQPVRLWRLPNTLSGDAAVTLFVQTIITYWIEIILVRADLHSGIVKPIRVRWWPKSRLMLFILDYRTPYYFTNWFCRIIEWLVVNAVRALFWSVPLFFLFWPATMGILCAPGEHRGNEYYYNHFPMPQLFKLIYGGTLGFVMTPWFAFLHMYMFYHKHALDAIAKRDEKARNTNLETPIDVQNASQYNSGPTPPTTNDVNVTGALGSAPTVAATSLRNNAAVEVANEQPTVNGTATTALPNNVVNSALPSRSRVTMVHQPIDNTVSRTTFTEGNSQAATFIGSDAVHNRQAQDTSSLAAEQPVSQHEQAVDLQPPSFPNDDMDGVSFTSAHTSTSVVRP